MALGRYCANKFSKYGYFLKDYKCKRLKGKEYYKNGGKI